MLQLGIIEGEIGMYRFEEDTGRSYKDGIRILGRWRICGKADSRKNDKEDKVLTQFG